MTEQLMCRKAARIAPRCVVAGICGYEVAAICSGRVPTVTQLCARRRWLGPVLVTALAVHLCRQR